MNKEQEFKIDAKSKHYVLATSEYIGTKKFKYLIRSELRGDGKVTLFLLGIPDPIVVYASNTNRSQDSVVKSLYQSAVDSVAKFISENEWTEGKTYYGEYLIDGSFEISDQKPEWEDGEWGQKI
jgi:hypothetical protein